MRKINLIIILLFCVVTRMVGQQKETLKLTLDDVIRIASRQSIDAFRSKNMYIYNYWQFKYYKSDRLPFLNLSGSPLDYSRRITKKYSLVDKKYINVPIESFGADATLSLKQKIGLTGGEVFVNSELDFLYDIPKEEREWTSVPVVVGFKQKLNGYNRMRWESKLEPLKYEKAKKDFIQDKEELAIKATGRFFTLVGAQIELTIAENSYSDADTLYNVGKGRFNIGTVTQDELLNLELKLLNSEVALNRAKLRLQRAKAQLNSFLRFDTGIEIECVIPREIPDLVVEVNQAIELAFINNPVIVDNRRREIEEDRKIAKVKSENGINTNLSASYGLNKSALRFRDTYNDPLSRQNATITLGVPILDWGRRKGQLEMARSNREVELAKLEQERIDFEQDVFMNVMEFNLQANQVYNSAKADTVAQKGYEVTLQRFLIGKVGVTKLNIARDEKESSKRSYVNALNTYWRYYYNLRKLTLFDFEKKQTLSEDFDILIQRL